MIQFNQLNRKGFTLVELIVVVAILAVLAVLAVVAFRGMAASARESGINDDAEHVATHLNYFLSTAGTYEEARAALGSISTLGTHAFNVLERGGAGESDSHAVNVSISVQEDGRNRREAVTARVRFDEEHGVWYVVAQ